MNAPEDGRDEATASTSGGPWRGDRARRRLRPSALRAPVGVRRRTRPLGHEPWHAWFALQGGHRGSGLTPQARYAGLLQLPAHQPVLETEAMYELVDCGGVADTDEARRSAWKALLCGCAGYTYGAAGMWALNGTRADTRLEELQPRDRGLVCGHGAARRAADDGAQAVLPRPALDRSRRALPTRLGQFADREESVLATGSRTSTWPISTARRRRRMRCGPGPGSLDRAELFDPRTGMATAIATDIRAWAASGRSWPSPTAIRPWCTKQAGAKDDP